METIEGFLGLVKTDSYLKRSNRIFYGLQMAILLVMEGERRGRRRRRDIVEEEAEGGVQWLGRSVAVSKYGTNCRN